MAEQDNQETEQEVVEGVQDQVIETVEEATLTQAQFDAALSERLNAIREQSASELRQLRENAEAQIRGYQQALQNVTRPQQTAQDEDDPLPVNMTPDQRLMWDANKPTRQFVKAQMKAIAESVTKSVNPVLQDGTVSRFFQGKQGIPENVKQSAVQMFSSILQENPGLNPQEVIAASYTRALAADYEAKLFGGQSITPGAKAIQKQPIVRAPNGSADIGGGTRPIVVGRVGKKNQTYQEIREELIASGKFPEDPL